jgi:hypothetical protein
MSTTAVQHSPFDRGALSRVAIAGVLTGVTDGLFSSVLSVAFYHSTVQRLFQGVASTLLGAGAFGGGNLTFAIGVLMHFGVAFAMVDRVSVNRQARALDLQLTQLSVRSGKGRVAVRPLHLDGDVAGCHSILLHRPPVINIRWLVQLIGHIPFVGIPIVWSIGRGAFRPGKM